MSKAERELLEVAAEVVKDFGVDLRVDRNHKHPRLVLSRAGRSRFVVFPKTGSDWRGNKNFCRDLRHEAHRLLECR